jgi:hypothetical protein
VTTPKDLRNPKRKSGYDHVGVIHGGARTKPYQAQSGTGNGHGKGAGWRGPFRRTALEAAQDYCNYINGSSAATPATPALKRAGHAKAKRKPITKAQQVALDILRDARAKPRTMGWVYLVIEDPEWVLSLRSVGKIGWTSKSPPEARLNDYQAGNPRKLVMVGSIKGTKKREANLHAKYIRDNVLGEWFRLSDALLAEFGLTRRDLR